MIEHLDETGASCTRHVPASEKLMHYAMLGSRVSGFHHDAASKLQSLVMALDEISELIGDGDSDLRTATDTAQTSLRQLHALLSMNRALAKPPQRAHAQLAELLAHAGGRHGVKVRGDVPAMDVMIAAPAITHAFAMLFDVIGGPPKSGRAVDVTAVRDGERVRISIRGTAETGLPNTNEMIGIAAYIVGREGGTFRCGPTSFVVELPLAQ